MVTRKLRRRAHCDPVPLSDGKRRKAATLSSLVYVLDDSEVEDDLKSLCQVSLLWRGWCVYKHCSRYKEEWLYLSRKTLHQVNIVLGIHCWLSVPVLWCVWCSSSSAWGREWACVRGQDWGGETLLWEQMVSQGSANLCCLKGARTRKVCVEWLMLTHVYSAVGLSLPSHWVRQV